MRCELTRAFSYHSYHIMSCHVISSYIISQTFAMALINQRSSAHHITNTIVVDNIVRRL